MKLRSLLLTWALPLAVAGAALFLGIWGANTLLHRQEQSYTLEASAVPVSDVRPYGDDYETMRQEVTAAILLEGDAELNTEYTDEDASHQGTDNASESVDEVSSARSEELDDQVRTNLRAFFDLWWQNQQPEASSFCLEESGEVQWYTDADGALGAAKVVCVNAETGYASCFYTTAESGIPVQAQLELLGDSPDLAQLWEALLNAYEQCCGLTFGEAELIAGGNYKWEYLDDDSLSVLSLSSATAVSSDLTFRLTLQMTNYANPYGYADTQQITLTLELND